MATNLIPLADFRPDAQSTLVQLLADAIADGRVTLVIEDPGDRDPADDAVAGAALVREGDIWTLTCRQRQVRVVDGKGVRYLATLLENPGVEIPALELAAEGGGYGPTRVSAAHAGPLLDAKAKLAYKVRLAELRDELELAESFDDHARVAQLQEELEFLARELAGAIGLGGRDRLACSNSERARVNVTRAIHSLIKRVASHDPVIGRELRATIRTGTFCAYEPDPLMSPAWRVQR